MVAATVTICGGDGRAVTAADVVDLALYLQRRSDSFFHFFFLSFPFLSPIYDVVCKMVAGAGRGGGADGGSGRWGGGGADGGGRRWGGGGADGGGCKWAVVRLVVGVSCGRWAVVRLRVF
ncbi:hypothetical protein DM860_012214 [Cuscuta australis]|uniref:Uncharacterized protein n=1 Tax=Cuscuta australis TaxID=267555 RepID=A0A328EAG1_9ASTE|nr:hypothetical protein DM860_012214 [Cuscuta australis]